MTKIIAKEIQNGIINNNLQEELVKMLPYNRQEECEYKRELANNKVNLFDKYILNVIAKYPSKKSNRNTYYEITDKKGNVIWKSNVFSIVSYKSTEEFHQGLELLRDIREGAVNEICDK